VTECVWKVNKVTFTNIRFMSIGKIRTVLHRMFICEYQKWT